MAHDFDPDGPALHDAGAYGLPRGGDAAATIISVPFEATVSFRPGTARGPLAIDLASRQVDLTDPDFGAVYRPGISGDEAPAWLRALSDEARAHAVRVIEAQERGEEPAASDLEVVERAGDRVNAHVRAAVDAVLDRGGLPVVVGGDHSVPFGAITACAARLGGRPLGVLHLDAHLDLRDAYEGFRWSHASIMKNVLDEAPNVRLVQVGLRDVSAAELDLVRREPERIAAFFDSHLRSARLRGDVESVLARAVALLPNDVYLSFDIDGLDPTLCPNTGTPVPGGLSFDELCALLLLVRDSGRRVVGVDLVEVAPAADVPDDALGDGWDENVGARVLYKMIGCAFATRGLSERVTLPEPRR